MVATMAYRDTEVDLAPHVAEAKSTPPDWRRLYEQALARAKAGEARAEELKSAELAARTSAGTYKGLFKVARRKRLAAVEDANHARRAAKNALALQAEVRRLHKLLAQAGVESGRYSVMGLRREIARLRKEVPRAEVQNRKIRKLHKALWDERVAKAGLRRILNDAMRDYHETRHLGDQAERVRSLTDETLDLRHALKRSEAVKDKLKVRLVRAVDTSAELVHLAVGVASRPEPVEDRHRGHGCDADRGAGAHDRAQPGAPEGRCSGRPGQRCALPS